MLRSLVLSLALLVFTVQPLLAQCVEQAIPELRQGAPLTILRTDGSVTRASFIRAEADPPRLVLDERAIRSQRAPRRIEVASSEIARLEAPPRRQFHAERIGIGALAGSGFGALLGVLVPVEKPGIQVTSPGTGNWTSPDSRGQAVLAYVVGGAVLGTLTGLFLSTGGGKPRTWTCAALPDSAQVPNR